MIKLHWIFLIGSLVILADGALSRKKRAVACVEYCDIDPEDRDNCPPDPADIPPNRVNSTIQLADLRDVMADNALTGQTKPIDAYLIYEGSYYGGGVTDRDKRLQFISGFTGSSGYVIVTRGNGGLLDRAALWTDGRYFLQADDEMDCSWILMKQGQTGTPSAVEWLLDILPTDALVGADPNFMATDTWKEFEEAFAADSKNIMLNEMTDLIDHVWSDDDRPAITNNPIYIHDLTYAGVSWQDKLVEIRNLTNGVADVLIVTLLDDIAWLFNLRGSDRKTSPLFDSMAMIWQTEARLYIRNVSKLLEDDIMDHLNLNATGTGCKDANPCVLVMEYDDALDDLSDFDTNPAIASIWINIGESYAVYQAAGSKRQEDYSPIQLPKSQKNSVEIVKYRECQIRDSGYLVDFMAMLETSLRNGDSWDELSASVELEGQNYRGGDVAFRMISFDTISAIGPNGAIIHYKPTEATKQPLNTNQMYLLDSGGNYLDGTTDVTRTFHFGTPTLEEIEAYTRVLMGVIDLAATVWPEGWKGSDIDARTRTPIWQNGWDYNHGTGHGIGYFLNVHEGPGRINVGYDVSHKPLYIGQTYSDEPGFYKDGSFGVRLETIVEVVEATVPNHFNDKKYLTFEPVTFVPFETNLINYDMLEVHHRKWLNSYHTKCLEKTGQWLDQNAQDPAGARTWLEARTAHVPDTPNYDGVTGAASPLTVTPFIVFLWAIIAHLI